MAIPALRRQRGHWMAKASTNTAASEPPAPKKRKSADTGRQLTAHDWVVAAQELLVNSSIDGVRVDILAKRLAVTRGSFYWHFEDRQDLLDRLLKHWRDQATENVIRQFESAKLPPEEIVNGLLKLPFRGRTAVQAWSVELAIRAWARRDDSARRVVDDVDAQRLSYIAQCFSALGHSIAAARVRAFALYGMELAEALLANQGTSTQRDERATFFLGKLLDVDPPSPAV